MHQLERKEQGKKKTRKKERKLLMAIVDASEPILNKKIEKASLALQKYSLIFTLI